MIRNYKSFNISKEDIQNLKNINPFWNKNVNKLIKKLKNWLIKFKKNPEDFKINFPVNYDQYNQLFKEIDNWIHFYNQKINLIKSNIKILRKFYKLIGDYVSLLGWTNFIEFICSFLNDIQKKEISNKKEYALLLLNSIIFKNFEIYKKEIFNILKEDDYIKILFERVFIPKNFILRIDIVCRNILKYAKILKKKNKITEDEFIGISVSTIELIIFALSFSNFGSIFFESIY
ncbi:hypothetical protein [Spiroplasma taiwanense]|uniref:Uncharacterized protein n=1 Tax=Spiroplasma taiwanense CT-1 TaxID=1276220 RepID=S5MGV5_9MOLU|nr:hypothetical protein [Spiroplasma taiwanense]AGR41080.1 hypothetical protein STAIW_v1c04340 [Spiroplasma taiwanense CT-1]